MVYLDMVHGEVEQFLTSSNFTLAFFEMDHIGKVVGLVESVH